ncbi:MAG: hypothetical protein Q7J66_00600 [Hydrogenophaga sp.]|nr:hypothetical protein [Hydrogenophaga sp.]
MLDESVDNFVKNLLQSSCNTENNFIVDNMKIKQGVRNTMKSIAWTNTGCFVTFFFQAANIATGCGQFFFGMTND